ncbi:mitochondrial carrier domain-containing protein [Lentinula detonsa]|uniref:Mitochondrial carrier domain-containing protein n=1 Tax=Lentinula detonsa TaxID=2804962 RepID=A0AA38PY10_9AGAR|nr:mitochondrial carrier domain-containing protein [Lentinula detonsa]
MTSAFPPLVQAISGAIGSASANTLTYPLDLVTTRVQLVSPAADTRLATNMQGSNKEKNKEQERGDSSALDSSKQLERFLQLKVVRILRSIVQSDGVGALYDGLFTDTASTLISNFFYFYIYSFLRKLLVRRLTRSQLNSTSLPRSISSKSLPSIKLAVWQDLALGFLSGVASRVVSMPLSIITLRLQIGRHDSEEYNSKREGHRNAVVQAVKEIYEEEGLSGFWRGFNTTILLSLNPSITLAFYQLFRRLLTITRRSPHTAQPTVLDPTPLEAFFGGAVSSSVAVALLYPLILSKTRLQAAHKSTSSSENTHSTVSAPTLISIMLDAYEGRYNRERTQKWDGNEGVAGIQGLYQGLEMQILKGFLNQGVTFLVKGRIEQLIIQTYMRHRLGNLSNLTLPSIPTPLDSSDPHRSLETWNIVEHVGRRYL